MSGDKRGQCLDAIDQFASAQAIRLLGKLAFQVRHAAKHADKDAIHDLRVAIRRLSQCLLEFHHFFPRHATKKILKRLDKVMDLAAEIRNRDVAVEFIGKSAGEAESALVSNLRRERERAQRKLTRALAQWRCRDFSRKWRPWLAL